MDSFPELLKLPLGQLAPGSHRDPPKLQWTNSRASQLDSRIANPVEHFANDPVLPLVDADPKPGTALLVSQRPHLLRADSLSFDRDPLAQCLEHGRRRMSIEQRLIFLLDAESWMRHPKGDVAVIRQQQQAGCVAVEPADRDDPLGNIDQIEHGPTATLVAGGRDVAIWFVQQDIATPFILQRVPIDENHLPLWVDLNAKLGDDRAIDRHPPLTNQLFGLAS